MKTPSHRKQSRVFRLHFSCLFFILLFIGAAFGSQSNRQMNSQFVDIYGSYMDVVGIEAGMNVGEIGVGRGALAFRLAKRVGPDGWVYANEIDENTLRKIEQKRVPNLTTVLGYVDDPRFPANDLDIVIMDHVFHDLEFPLAMLENITQYIKTDALLVVIEEVPEPATVHPRLLLHGLPEDELLAIIKRSSFKHLDTHQFPQFHSKMYTFAFDKQKSVRVWPDWQFNFQKEFSRLLTEESNGDWSSEKKWISWVNLLDRYRDNNPQTHEDERLRDSVENKIAVLKRKGAEEANLSSGSGSRQTSGNPSEAKIRSDYRTLDKDEINASLVRLGFKPAPRLWQSSGDFPNRYEARTIEEVPVVQDLSADLMWHPSGSKEPMDYYQAWEWVAELNRTRYAGFSDWRLPALEEALTLFEIKGGRETVAVNPLFSPVQQVIWTGDSPYGGRAWLLNFMRTYITIWEDQRTNSGFVRPVRK